LEIKGTYKLKFDLQEGEKCSSWMECTNPYFVCYIKKRWMVSDDGQELKLLREEMK